MRSSVLASLRAHAGRLASSGIAVAIGVAFVTGTLIFTATLQAGFAASFASGDKGIDVAITPLGMTGPAIGPEGRAVRRPELAPSLVAEVLAVPGVHAAAGELVGRAVVLDARGHAFTSPSTSIGAAVPLTNAFGWLELTTGRRPAGGREVVLDGATAAGLGLKLGDTVRIVGASGLPRSFTLVGTVATGISRGFEGVSVAGFDLATTEPVTGRHGYREIDVAADPGVSQATLAARIGGVLGPGYAVRTGAQKTQDDETAVVSRASVIGTVLLIFALIAVLVASIVIANTFRVLVTQRSRELALERCIGASRLQVFAAILAESAATGLVASVAGVAGGAGMAAGLHALVSHVHNGLPPAGLRFPPGAAVTGILVGTLVTVAAALLPARSATRVAPLAALRAHSDTAIGGKLTAARIAWALGLAGIGALVIAGNLGAGGNAPALVLGGAIALVGFLVAGPLLVAPMTKVVGFPARVATRVTGRLACLTMTRNPSRSASSMASLTIGLTLVTLFSVAAASFVASVDRTIARNFPFGYIIMSGGGGMHVGPAGTVPVAVAAGIRSTGEFSRVFEERADVFAIDGRPTVVSGVTPQLMTSSGVQASSGSFGNFRPGSVLLDASLAHRLHVRAGDTVVVGGGRLGEDQATVAAIFSGELPVAGLVMPLSDFAARSPSVADDVVFATAKATVSPTAARRAIQRVVDPYPLVQAQDLATFEGDLASGVDRFVEIFSAMLVLALVISFIGIANTLTLSILERHRELGLMRALGATRRQMRTMLSIEGALLAAMGALTGVAIGIAAAWGIVLALRTQGVTVFTVPVARVVAYVVISAIAGVVASVLPARRAARTSPIAALAIDE